MWNFVIFENLTREAFWNVYRPGCTEHYVLHCYRSEPDFVPELSLVLELDGEIIGHVMYAWSHIDADDPDSDAPYFLCKKDSSTESPAATMTLNRTLSPCAIPKHSRSTIRNFRTRKSSCCPDSSNPVTLAQP